MLQSLMAQDITVDKIELYIPRTFRRFPDYDGHLPTVPDGIEIIRPETDIGPATKILFAVERYKHMPDAQLLFCDDDRIYAPDWARQLFSHQERRPEEAVAFSGWNVETIGLSAYSPRAMPQHRKLKRWQDVKYRWARLKQSLGWQPERLSGRKPIRRLVQRAGYADVGEGNGGFVVRSVFFGQEVFDIPDVGWAVDDVWLSGMLANNGVKIWLPAGIYAPIATEAEKVDALHQQQAPDMMRATLDLECAKHLQQQFGVWTDPPSVDRPAAGREE
jgi:hypothetical protein